MSESGNEKEVVEQMASSQHEDLQSEAHIMVDSSERPCLKETNEAKQQGLTDFQGKLKDDNALEGPRRSERTRYPTEKMRAHQLEEAKKKEKRLYAMYEQWKLHTRKARDQLKSFMSESQLWPLIEELKKEKEDIMTIYFEIRNLTTPSTDIRRRVDTCESVTTEITNIAYSRAIDNESEFNEQQERHRLHELLRHDYAKSVYGSAASSLSHSQSDSHSSITTSMKAKRVDAAAELAVKESNYQMLLEEERQKESIRELEEQQRKALEAQRRELERLQAEKEIRAAQAKLKIYDKETEHKDANHAKRERNMEAKNVPVTALPLSQVASPRYTDVPSLAQILQDNIALNRLPVPEPFVFNGNPIQFIEWKAAFTSLIDQRAITPAES